MLNYDTATIVKLTRPIGWKEWDTIEPWLREKTIGKVEYIPSEFDGFPGRVYFEHESDAVLFTLRWS